jgi:putative spermidine/putrescine transport system ATP-binding protein
MNRLAGRVLEPIYHGDHVRLRLSVAGSEDFTVKVPVIGGKVDLSPGREIWIGWHAEDCRALDPVPGG